MKYKKLMLVTLLLLAIITMGAVSAVEDTNDTLTADNGEELSLDLDDEIISIEQTEIQTKETDEDKLTATVVDNSSDESVADVNGTLILTDVDTGDVVRKNIAFRVKANYSTPYTSDLNDTVNETVNQLLSIAEIESGGRDVTLIKQNVSDEGIIESFDYRIFRLANTTDDNGDEVRYLLITGNYGATWLVNITIEAQYASSDCIISFNATGGEGVMANASVKNNTDYTLPECGFTKEYRVFYGWNVGDAIRQPGENITVTDNIIIKTVWKYDVEPEPGKAKIFDTSYDGSTTSINGTLILTDASTGEAVVKNVTFGPVKSTMTNATAKEGANLSDVAFNQLLSIAQILAGSKEVTVKNQTVSNFTRNVNFDNRTYDWMESPYEGADDLIPTSMQAGFMLIGGKYGTEWVGSVILEAEYSREFACLISFDATGGEGVMANVTVENNTDYTLPECGFTKEYRVFYGWNVGDAIKQPGENITVTDNITVKTVWKYAGEVKNTGANTVRDYSVDSSKTSIYGILILTDAYTGDVVVKNITVGPVKSSMANATANEGTNLTDVAINQLLTIAQMLVGSKVVTVKNQSVSNFTTYSRYDNRWGYVWIESPYEGSDDLIAYSMNDGFMFIGGDYGTLWNGSVILEAEYSSEVVNVANVKVVLSKNAFTYNAKAQKPTVTVINGLILKEGVDYTLKWSSDSPTNAGTYSITVTGTGSYTGTAQATFKIDKALNPLQVKAKTAKVKFSKLKKKAQKLAVTKVVKFTKKGQGTLTYKKVKGNKKIAINKKNGKVTVKKGLKKGTYKVKVKIKANGNANYKPSAFKTITFKIKVK